MGPVTVIAAAAVVVVAVMLIPAAAVPAVAAVPAAVAVPAATAVPAAVEVAVAVASWMCVRALQTQEADVGRQMEAQPADRACLAPGHAQHAQQAEPQAMQVERQEHLDQWAAALLGRQR